MEKYFKEFLNIYFWVFNIIIFINVLVFILESYFDTIEKKSVNHSKLFNIIMWTIYIMSINELFNI